MLQAPEHWIASLWDSDGEPEESTGWLGVGKRRYCFTQAYILDPKCCHIFLFLKRSQNPGYFQRTLPSFINAKAPDKSWLSYQVHAWGCSPHRGGVGPGAQGQWAPGEHVTAAADAGMCGPPALHLSTRAPTCVWYPEQQHDYLIT